MTVDTEDLVGMVDMVGMGRTRGTIEAVRARREAAGDGRGRRRARRRAVVGEAVVGLEALYTKGMYTVVFLVVLWRNHACTYFFF